TQVIGILSNSRNIHSHEKALDILQHMKRVYDEGSGGSNIRPNAVTYATVINAFARKGDIVGSKKGDAEGATDILKMMEDDCSNSVKKKHLKPNVRTYSTLINAWSKSGRDDAPQEAKKLLDKVIDLHSKGDLDEGPNVITYNSVIDSYAVQGDVEGASTILKMLEDDFQAGNLDAKPDMRTYSTFINAISKSGDIDAPKQAEDVLKKMNDLFLKGELDEAPSAITYSSVMDAYAAEGDINGATNILKLMKDAYTSGNKAARPNLRTYNILINTISKSGTENAPQQAEILLTTMIYLFSIKELPDGPNLFSYNTVMDAYAVQGDTDGASDVHE
ncbi:hypothetical protein FRACYDRAFT_137581, partial [Fragilariopsis cylindrus CCMP1102]